MLAFKGNASPVAIKAPQRMAMANTHGDSRSRRSRYRRISTGTVESSAERMSAIRKILNASARSEAIVSRMKTVENSSAMTSAPITHRATHGLRSGEPTSNRSSVELTGTRVSLFTRGYSDEGRTLGKVAIRLATLGAAGASRGTRVERAIRRQAVEPVPGRRQNVC